MPARFRRDRHVGKDQVWQSRPWATNASATAWEPSASISASHPKHLIFTVSSSAPRIFVTTSKKHSSGIDGASIAAERIAEENTAACADYLRFPSTFGFPPHKPLFDS